MSILSDPRTNWMAGQCRVCPWHGDRQSLTHGQVTVYSLVGLVVKASASRAEDPGFEFHLRRDFPGRVIPVT